MQFLRHKGKRRQPRETRGHFSIVLTIRERAAEVRQRQTFGHWELDTVVLSRGKSKECVAMFAVQKTRMTDRTAVR